MKMFGTSDRAHGKISLCHPSALVMCPMKKYEYTSFSERPHASLAAVNLISRGGASAPAEVEGVLANVAAASFSALTNASTWIGGTRLRCWVILMTAIVIEIFATTLTKVASDSSDPMKMTFAMSLYLMSLLSFAASLAQIDVSIAYAVWSAFGTALVSVAGMTLFGETCDLIKIGSISLIILGVIGLNLSDGGH